MCTLAAGHFKQTCLRVLDEVRESGEPVVITKRGIPVAKLVPVEAATDWMGSMRGSATLRDDLISPAADRHEWDAESG